MAARALLACRVLPHDIVCSVDPMPPEGPESQTGPNSSYFSEIDRAGEAGKTTTRKFEGSIERDTRMSRSTALKCG